MAREDEILANEGSPGMVKIGKWDGEVNLFRSWIASDLEPKAAIRGVLEEPFVVATLMIHCYFGVTLEEVRERREWVGNG